MSSRRTRTCRTPPTPTTGRGSRARRASGSSTSARSSAARATSQVGPSTPRPTPASTCRDGSDDGPEDGPDPCSGPGPPSVRRTLMSDDRLRLIPTDPAWVPDDVALRRAVRVLRTLAPDAGSVRGAVHDEGGFVDAGGNARGIGCPACGAALEEEWWAGRVERAAATGYSRLAVTTPCCATRTTLNHLDHLWAARVAPPEVGVTRPPRGRLA